MTRKKLLLLFSMSVAATALATASFTNQENAASAIEFLGLPSYCKEELAARIDFLVSVSRMTFFVSLLILCIVGFKTVIGKYFSFIPTGKLPPASSISSCASSHTVDMAKLAKDMAISNSEITKILQGGSSQEVHGHIHKLLLDSKFRITSISGTFSKKLGYLPEELKKCDAFLIVRESEHEMARTAFRRIADEEETSLSEDITFISKDGLQEIPTRVTIIPTACLGIIIELVCLIKV